ncbi:hypothetical protein C8Q80DRAFT_1267565 [Daedaleopsis nitida]|nr:hypothetical protein C8Q80DRAFT_1267565 [Daedaleopsis nitida]
MSTSILNDVNLVIDDINVNFNISRDSAQLPIITAPSVSFWQNVTGYTRVAVYGSLVRTQDVGYTPWANYTIDGNSTAANLTTQTHVVTDYPLFISGPLDPDKQYNLTVDVVASPDAPYLLDYLLAYSPATATPIFSSSSSTSPTSTPTMTAVAEKGGINFKSTVVYVAAGLGAGVVLLAIIVVVLLKRVCCARAKKSKSLDKEASIPPAEPPFDPRPQKSATLTSGKSSHTAFGSVSSPSGLSEPAAPLLSLAHARTLSIPAEPISFPVPAPSAPTPPVMGAVGEAARPATPAFGPASSAPYLQLPSAMATPTNGPLLDPFATPASGVSVPTPHGPHLYNPYDLIAPAAAETSFSSSAVRPDVLRSASTLSLPSMAPSTSVLSTAPASTYPAPARSTTLGASATPATPAVPAVPAHAPSISITSVTTPTPVQDSDTAGVASSSLGPNEYPKEKQEIRMDPPKQQLYAVNTDTAAAASPHNPWEGSTDSPPAYGA